MADDAPVTDLSQMPKAEEPKEAMDAALAEQAPSRLARRMFVYVSMAISWLTGVVFAILGFEAKNAHLLVDSCMTYCIMMGALYLGAHTVDRGEFVSKLLSRNKESQ